MSRARKAGQHAAVQARLDMALLNLYHNATPQHPYDQISDLEWEIYQSWFGDQASMEIDYIWSGGPYGTVGSTGRLYYGPKPASERDQSYQERAARIYARKIAWDMARPAGMFRAETLKRFGIKGEWPYSDSNDLWCRISDYGKPYQWGRGGRTLAPDQLIRQGGGGSFSTLDADDLALSYQDVVTACQIIESFNKDVETWCSRENLSYMWKDFKEMNAQEDDERAEEELEEARYFA